VHTPPCVDSFLLPSCVKKGGVGRTRAKSARPLPVSYISSQRVVVLGILGFCLVAEKCDVSRSMVKLELGAAGGDARAARQAVC